MTTTQDGLFPAPDAPAEGAPGVGAGRPRWERITTRGRCDECLAVLAAGAEATPQPARWRHRRPGGKTEFLCYEHARQRRRTP